MKYIGILMTVLFLSFFSVNAQEYKFFKAEKTSYGTVTLILLSNKDLYKGINQSPVYFGKNFDKYMTRVSNIMVTAIPQEIWDKITKSDKEKIRIDICFDKTGLIFKMEVDLPDDVLNNTTEEQWYEICNQLKSINIIPYLLLEGYDKEHFVHGRIFLRPLMFHYRTQEKKNRLRP